MPFSAVNSHVSGGGSFPTRYASRGNGFSPITPGEQSSVTIVTGSNANGEWIEFYNDDELIKMVQTMYIIHSTGGAVWFNLPKSFPDVDYGAAWSTESGYRYSNFTGRETGRVQVHAHNSTNGSNLASNGYYQFIWVKS